MALGNVAKYSETGYFKSRLSPSVFKIISTWVFFELLGRRPCLPNGPKVFYNGLGFVKGSVQW